MNVAPVNMEMKQLPQFASWVNGNILLPSHMKHLHVGIKVRGDSIANRWHVLFSISCYDAKEARNKGVPHAGWVLDHALQEAVQVIRPPLINGNLDPSCTLVFVDGSEAIIANPRQEIYPVCFWASNTYERID